MKATCFVLTVFLTATFAQTYPECTAELVRTDECTSVIDANACYNKFRWNAQTLTCIDGKDTATKQKMVTPKPKPNLQQRFANETK